MTLGAIRSAGVIGDPLDAARAEVARLVEQADVRGLIAAADLPITSIRLEVRPGAPSAVRIDAWEQASDLVTTAAGRPTPGGYPWPRARTFTIGGLAASAAALVSFPVAPSPFARMMLVIAVGVSVVAGVGWWTAYQSALGRWTHLMAREPLAVFTVEELDAPRDPVLRAAAAYLRAVDAAARVEAPLSRRLHDVADRLASVVGGMARLAAIEGDHAELRARLRAAGIVEPIPMVDGRPIGAVLAASAAQVERQASMFDRLVALDAVARDPRIGTGATMQSRITTLVRGIEGELAETGAVLSAGIAARTELYP
jgi:hypothetical protein